MGRDILASSLREKWQSDIPLLYDWLMSHHLMWPSLSCRWGPVLQSESGFSVQRVFLSEQTDGEAPNTLVAAAVRIPSPHTIPPSVLPRFAEDDLPSPVFAFGSRLVHPGEVNRIREIKGWQQGEGREMVATHTDGPDVFVWDLMKERPPLPPNADITATPATPDLTLTGHTDDAEFALATSRQGAAVLSGGKDRSVVLWNLEDASTSAASGGKLQARGVFSGHKSTVEDVQFHPSDWQQFCSVGDDYRLLIFDSRAGQKPITQVERAHAADLHCIDWSSQDDNFLLTGSADTTVRLFDRRKLATIGRSEAVQIFKHHSEPVTSVEFCPDKRGVFASGADDGLVCVWDGSKVMVSGNGGEVAHIKSGQRKTTGGGGSSATAVDQPVFEHLGHRHKIAEVQWNPSDPSTLMSSSIDSGKVGGGTLQVWRTSELVLCSEEEALKTLDDWQRHAA